MNNITRFNKYGRGPRKTNIYLFILLFAVGGLALTLALGEITKSPVTYSLIAMNVIVFGLVRLNRAQVSELGSSYEHSVYDKEFYRVVTAAFTHREVWHILMNMYSLYNLGGVLEPLVGSARFATMYIIIMLLGGVLSLIIHKKHGPFTLAIGASGVLCGLLGVYIVIVVVLVGLSGIRYFAATLLCLGIMCFSKRIDNIGHLAGLIVGIIYGVCLIVLG